MATVLVTGGHGYLGSALVRALRERAIVVAPSKSELDVSSDTAWLNHVVGVDVVYHLAARETPNQLPADSDADYRVNAGSILALARACTSARCFPRIIFASSTNLVGCPTSVPIDEATPPDPLTLYAIHKYAAERYLGLVSDRFDSVTLRLPNIYGTVGNSELDRRMVVNRMIERGLAGDELTLFANRQCVRDFLHVDDVVKALIAAADIDAKGASLFVIGSGVGVALETLVHLIASSTSKGVHIRLDDERALGPAEWRNIIVNASAFAEATGWRPELDLEAGISKTIGVLGARS